MLRYREQRAVKPYGERFHYVRYFCETASFAACYSQVNRHTINTSELLDESIYINESIFVPTDEDILYVKIEIQSG